MFRMIQELSLIGIYGYWINTVFYETRSVSKFFIKYIYIVQVGLGIGYF